MYGYLVPDKEKTFAKFLKEDTYTQSYYRETHFDQESQEGTLTFKHVCTQKKNMKFVFFTDKSRRHYIANHDISYEFECIKNELFVTKWLNYKKFSAIWNCLILQLY